LNCITTADGTEIFYNDWGMGPPVLFSHGWPLNSDSYEPRMLFLAPNGFRCIARDRRGHGAVLKAYGGAPYGVTAPTRSSSATTCSSS